MMEVDLRDDNENNRTLHYFIDGKQQISSFNNLPPSVIFAVYLLLSLFLLFFQLLNFIFFIFLGNTR